MTDDPRDLAASAALGALPPDEAAQLEDELHRNPALSPDADEYRATVTMLESGVARELPSADLFDGVLARIEDERAAAQPRSPEPSTAERKRLFGRPRQWLPAFGAGAATAAAVLAIVLAMSSGDGGGSPAARATVQGTPDFATVHGEARLYAPERDDGRISLDLADVPRPAPGEHYQVWVLRKNDGGEMESVGAFTPAGADVTLELPLPGPGDYAAVDVSIEPDGGSAEHSGRSLAGGSFES